MIRISRRLSQLRTVLGTVDLIFPGTVVRFSRNEPFHRHGRKVVRVLGVRQLAQAAVTGSRPTAPVLVLGAQVDGAHAVSMVALALWSRPGRRAALVDAAIAALFSSAGLLAAHQDRRRIRA
jgi:hypothetical protein